MRHSLFLLLLALFGLTLGCKKGEKADIEKLGAFSTEIPTEWYCKIGNSIPSSLRDSLCNSEFDAFIDFTIDFSLDKPDTIFSSIGYYFNREGKLLGAIKDLPQIENSLNQILRSDSTQMNKDSSLGFKIYTKKLCPNDCP